MAWSSEALRLLSGSWAKTGDRATPESVGINREVGFDDKYSLPKQAGGVGPQREVVNQVWHEHQEVLRETMLRGVGEWSSSINYPVGANVNYVNDNAIGGSLFRARSVSGPARSVGPVIPGTNLQVWERQDPYAYHIRNVLTYKGTYRDVLLVNPVKQYRMLTFVVSLLGSDFKQNNAIVINHPWATALMPTEKINLESDPQKTGFAVGAGDIYRVAVRTDQAPADAADNDKYLRIWFYPADTISNRGQTEEMLIYAT